MQNQEQTEQNIAPEKPDKKGSFTKSLLEQLELIVIFFAIMMLIFSLVCRTCKVDGDSMNNTLQDSETVLVWNLFYTPQYGDIVVIHDNDDLKKPIVKRIIGLPGDTIRVQHFESYMTVTVTHSNGTVETLNEDYITYSGYLWYYSPDETYTVSEGEVFVMGDNRLNSKDSRELGCYDTRQILGKIILRLLPLNKIGTVS